MKFIRKWIWKKYVSFYGEHLEPTQLTVDIYPLLEDPVLQVQNVFDQALRRHLGNDARSRKVVMRYLILRFKQEFDQHLEVPGNERNN